MYNAKAFSAASATIQKVNEAYGRLEKADVKYRVVIDMASLRG